MTLPRHLQSPELLAQRIQQAQHTRNAPALPRGLSAERAKDKNASIIGYAADHPPLWARAVKRCFSEDLGPWRAKRAKVFTDGAGIDAPMESLRNLAAVDVVRRGYDAQHHHGALGGATA